MKLDAADELKTIVEAMAAKAVELEQADLDAAHAILDEVSKVSSSVAWSDPPAAPVTELVTIFSNQNRARSQKVTNLIWEPDKTLFELFRNTGSAALGTSGVSMAAQALTGVAALTAPAIILPAIAVASIAAGLRWSGRVSVPIRAAYILYHAWRISEYEPDGHQVAIADLIKEIPVMVAEYPITDLSETKLTEDLNQLIGLRCLELVPLRGGAGPVNLADRRARLLEKVKITKRTREFL